MNIAVWLQRGAKLHSRRPALFSGRDCLADYATLGKRVAALAAGLAVRFRPGTRVALFLPNTPRYVELLFGCWHAGLVVVPVNHKLHPRELDWILQHCGAALLFCEGIEGLGLDAACECIDIGTPKYGTLFAGSKLTDPLPRAPDDLAWLFYTSGTTGRPKGAMLSHRNLMAMSLAYFAGVEPVSAEDAALYAAPMSHGAGMYMLPHVLAGARHVVPASRGFDPEEIFALSTDLGPCSMFAAPTMVKRMVDAATDDGRSGEGLRTIVYGGGPMYVEDIRRAVARLGARFVQIYGQGESPMTITSLRREQIVAAIDAGDDATLASVGYAQAPVELSILDERDEAVAAGTPGEVCVRGDPVMLGYWNDADATARTLRHGWLHTGDVGVLDERGCLALLDRSKDVIISGGSNIYPREVEEVLLRHPGIAEVSVLGRPDPEWGECVVAFVVARPQRTIDREALDALCREQIARFKRPREYLFVDALPKNAYGKVLKSELRKRLA